MTNTSDTYGDDATRGNLRLGPGTLLGVYRLDEPLGRGGMGMVWKAWDTAGQRPVALKLLPPDFTGNEAAIAQVREAFQVVHALTHQHIGKTIGLFDDARFGPYIVMEYLPGIPLTQFAKKYRRPDGTLPVETVVEVLRPVAQALDYGHGKGVLHRDVKPDNILVEDKGGEPGDVWLIDYGLAAEIRATAVTHTNASVDTRGTRPYMAPEQFKGKRHLWDGRTDQYALAVVAYELLAGRKPLEADDDMGLMNSILKETPDFISNLSTDLNAVILEGLAKEKVARHQSCFAFIEALSRDLPMKLKRADTQEAPHSIPSKQQQPKKTAGSLHSKAAAKKQKSAADGSSAMAADSLRPEAAESIEGSDRAGRPLRLLVLGLLFSLIGLFNTSIVVLYVVGRLCEGDVYSALCAAPCIFIAIAPLVGGACMAVAKCRSYCIFSSFVLALTPSPVCLLSFPVGIFAAIVLYEPQIRDAFRLVPRAAGPPV